MPVGSEQEPGHLLGMFLEFFDQRPVVRFEEPDGSVRADAATLPWLRERGVSVIVADASQDVNPSGYANLDIPVHQVGLVAMGLWLIDAAQFDDLVPHCERLNRWDFMFTVAPLNFPGVTGSPVTPLAML